jgi:catechol 2,3-dioxygenase-like lactoylglutathione lyase family enzyme
MLASSDLIAFGATTQPAQARAFYEGILGLPCVADEPFALIFNAHGIKLRISKVAALTPAPYTILGWAVSDIAACITALVQQGVTFERYPGVAHDALGACSFPNGDKVAWFKDPDGNLLSLTQFDQPAL